MLNGKSISLVNKIKIPYINEMNTNADLNKIDKIGLNFLNNKEMINYSDIFLKNSALYQDKVPAKKGVLDKFLGTLNLNETCENCNLDFDNCPGHFGLIKLEEPIFHTGSFKKILNILKSICLNCFNILLSNKEINSFIKNPIYSPKLTIAQQNTKFKQLVDKARSYKFCNKCEYPLTKISKSTKECTKIYEYFEDSYFKKNELKNKTNELLLNKEINDKIYEIETKRVNNKSRVLTPKIVKNILKKIPNDQKLIFSKNFKIEDLILDMIIVPPNCIRPSVNLGNGKTNEDDLTIKVYEMLKQTQYIISLKKEGLEAKKYYDSLNILQGIHCQYINSETTNLPKEIVNKNGTKGISQRLKGKMGRFRGNLSGKRVEYSGRTVISPDPNLDINQVSIPYYIAINLTFPERATSFNMEILKKLIINGPKNYPGAIKVLFKTKNQKIQINKANKCHLANTLSIGDIVYRHLLDDDWVLFNRQPSLHKLSIMGFRAKVMKKRTLSFNECVCNPFNADFDGDEMNIHLIQTLEAKYEVMSLMNSKNNIINPKNGEPIITLIQDFITSSFILTNKDKFYGKNEFQQIISFFTDSLEKINISAPSIYKPYPLWTGKQVINELLKIGFKNLIINIKIKEKNYNESMNLKEFDLNDGYVNILNSELISGNLGKSTLGGNKEGLIYQLISYNSNDYCAKILNRFAKLSSRYLIFEGMSLGISDVTPSDPLVNFNNDLIKKSFKSCEKIIDDYSKGGKESKPGCTIEESIESDLTNILNDVRNEAGKKCSVTLSNKNSALLMAVCGSKGSNLNLCQMISCVGQQTVAGKRIPDGFTKRSLPHFFLNDKSPESRGFVKNSFYSGLNSTEFFFHTMAGREGLIDTAVKTADTGYMQRKLMKVLEDIKVEYDYTVRNSEGNIVCFSYGYDGVDPVKFENAKNPINFSNVLNYCRSYFLLNNFDNKKDSNKVLKNYLNSKINELLKYLKNNNLVYNEITIKNVKNLSNLENILDYCNNKNRISFYFEYLKEKYKNIIIQPGEAVGALAAQSIGEPCTQMTLKTFHFAGVASMNVTLGVPRIKEIMNVTTNIQTPIIEVPLKFPYDKIRSISIKNQIETLYISDICKSIKEVYTISSYYWDLDLDEEFLLNSYIKVTNRDIKIAILGARIKLKEKNVLIINKFKIRIMPYDNISSSETLFLMKKLVNIIPNIKVKGIFTISRAILNYEKIDNKDKFKIYAEGTGLNELFLIEDLDYYKIQSNNIIEVYNIFGIEAVRNKIIEQIIYTIENYAIKVNIRHIYLLADLMTITGKVLGLNRYGIDKLKNSPFQLASFERTLDILFDSAFYGKVDNINGISENIICGQNFGLGTSTFDILFENKIKQEKIRNNKQYLFN